MAIQLDPVTKLPIWPDGKVPPHPRNRNGELIAAKPTWQPPPEPWPEPGPKPPPDPDVMQQIMENLSAMRREIKELKARVDAIPPA